MSRHVNVAVATVVAGCLLGAGGCEADRAGPAPVPSATGYLGDASFIGRTVTISGWVVQVITETSFVVDTRQNGAEPLLVLCAPSRDVEKGSLVIVSGNVQRFYYSAYADEYALAPDADVYSRFAADPFLVTRRAMALQ
ncbi:hypothetical protein [Paractinoplanes atraurantiacus]|uniref:Lipoprotein n=1 Tax=Paractinoplanes atraurantiacus TaxID=1036182 RepID=A0A285GPP9_9ACTN|nr:hypothetical protein [Actinoplanes atraurantiacus]SNY25517.1 hypothetical protein SAMN05421748_102355 [Actinoplanes atraurantiacus]